jgi:endonuclease III
MELVQLIRDNIPGLECNRQRASTMEALICCSFAVRTRMEDAVKVYATLKRRCPRWADVLDMDTAELQGILKPLGMQRSRASNLKAWVYASKPRYTMYGWRYRDLIELPGVGRKLAECALLYGSRGAYAALDTHGIRVAMRYLGDGGPDMVRMLAESDRDDAYTLHMGLMLVGRTWCDPSEAPDCSACPLSSGCLRLGVYK